MQHYTRIIIEKFSRRGRREAGGGKREEGARQKGRKVRQGGEGKARDFNDFNDFNDFKVVGMSGGGVAEEWRRSGGGCVLAQKKPRIFSVAFKRYCSKSVTCSQ